MVPRSHQNPASLLRRIIYPLRRLPIHYVAEVVKKAKTYNSGENGRIYTIPLMDSNGEIVSVKAFSVENILKDKICRDEVKFNPMFFCRLSKETLQEASKPLPRKHLDILLGNPDLALQLVCETGYGCQDCANGCCL